MLVKNSHIKNKCGHNRSSRLEVLCKEDVLRNFAKLKEKQLCQRIFFNKAACLRSLRHFKGHPRWLFLP